MADASPPETKASQPGAAPKTEVEKALALHQAALDAYGPGAPATQQFAESLAQARARRDAVRATGPLPKASKASSRDLAAREQALKEALAENADIEEIYSRLTDSLELSRRKVVQCEEEVAKAREAVALSQTEASAATAATLIKSILELLSVAETEAANTAADDGPMGDHPPAALAALLPLRQQLEQVGTALSAAAPKPATQEPARLPTNLDEAHDPFHGRIDEEGDIDLFGRATDEEVRAALGPLGPAYALQPPPAAGPRPADANAPAAELAPVQLALPGISRAQACAAMQNLLRLHRSTLTPYGDGPAGQAAREAVAQPQG
jgi:hypothetical protein